MRELWSFSYAPTFVLIDCVLFNIDTSSALSTKTKVRLKVKHPRKLFFRIVALLLAGFVFYFVFDWANDVVVTYQALQSPEIDVASIPYNDATKAALDIKLEQSRNQLAFTAVLAGVVWGLVIVNKDSPTIGWDDLPEGIVFILANLTIIVNVVCQLLYMRTMWTLMAVGGIQSKGNPSVTLPNFLDDRFDMFANAQQWTLLCGLLIVGLLVVSTHKLKD